MNSKQVKKEGNQKQKTPVAKVVKQKMEKEEPEADTTQTQVQTQQEQKQTKKTSEKNKSNTKKVDTKKTNENKDSKVNKKGDKNVPVSTKETATKENTEEDKSKSRFETQLALIRSEVKNVRETLHTLNSSLKSLESVYNQSIKHATKAARKQKREKRSGFITTKPVPEKLADFIGVAPGTEMARPDVAKQVWQKLRERNLIDKDDGRVFRTDKVVSEVFGVPASVNKIKSHKDKKGFNFYNLQTYVKNAYPQEEA